MKIRFSGIISFVALNVLFKMAALVSSDKQSVFEVICLKAQMSVDRHCRGKQMCSLLCVWSVNGVACNRP